MRTYNKFHHNFGLNINWNLEINITQKYRKSSNNNKYYF